MVPSMASGKSDIRMSRRASSSSSGQSSPTRARVIRRDHRLDFFERQPMARCRSVLIVAVVGCMSVLTIGQERDRAKVENKYKWNLADIFPGLEAWRTEKARVTAEIPTIRAFAGRLGTSPQTLTEALDTASRLDKELSRLFVYASMFADED